jgi:hypothetical protein
MRMLLHINPFLVEYVRKQQQCAHLPSKSVDQLPIQTGAMLSRSYTNISPLWLWRIKRLVGQYYYRIKQYPCTGNLDNIRFVSIAIEPLYSRI